MRWLPIIALTVVATLAPAVGQTATVTTTFTVQITITNACTIVSATNMNFGSVGVIGASGVDATSTITVQCTSSAPYTIGLSAGTGSGASQAITVYGHVPSQSTPPAAVQDGDRSSRT